MVGRRVRRWLQRHGLKTVLALVLVFSGLSLRQAWDIASHLRHEARESSERYSEIIAALGDTTPGADTDVLLKLAESLRHEGVPIVVTDTSGRPKMHANLPPDVVAGGDDAIRGHVIQLDRINVPRRASDGSLIHFGSLPVARRLNWLRGLQLGVLVLAVAVGVWAYRTAVERHRDRIWVAMARESAHQLGTPLMSAGAWVDRLNELPDPAAREVGGHLAGDLERLERVAQRFERIGRPARRDQVGLGALAERVAAYFAPRLPKRSNPVVVRVEAPNAGPMVPADPVLLEWALEALVRNAIDALSGQGGNVTIAVHADQKHAVLTVIDDGPGIDPEVRSQVFEPGVSTKRGGWGIGLALARRIVEDVHGGRLEHMPSERGAVFRADIPVTGGADDA